MSKERWQKIKELFRSALEREPAERAAFLDRACAGHDSLRAEIDSLIKSHESGAGFMDTPALAVVAEVMVEEKLLVGKLLGHYEIIHLLGEGGMGEVYLARDRLLSRQVAIKVLPTFFTADPDRLRRFEQEAQTASSLNHPNILTIHEIGKDDSHHFIAMEYVDGESLRERITSGQLKTVEALEVAIQVGSALDAAHAEGIIHRDIKPENIMLRRDGFVKVLDFGLAKLIMPQTTDSEASTKPLFKTDTGVVMGTASYMSPEQARGLAVDVRTDIFNLGIVVYEMVSGHAPFTGPTTGDTIVNILEHEPPPLTKFMPDAPLELQRIIKKALRKNAEDRYQTIKDLLVDLRTLKQEMETTERPSSRALWLVEKINRKHVALIVLALLATAALAFAVYKFAAPRDPAISQPVGHDAAETVAIVRTTQITFSQGLDSQPALSPDGNSIAYSSDQDGSFEIYVKQLTPGGREVQLTSDRQQNFHAAWSPDGQRIAYWSKNRGGIWVVPAMGGIPKQLSESGARPKWSPDGSMIALQSSTPSDFSVSGNNAMPPSTIRIIPSQGGTARQLTQVGNPPGGHGAPSWSPDGKRIVFDSSDFLSESIWTVSVEGGDLRQFRSAGSDAIYSPDGKHIYYSGLGIWKLRVSPVTSEPVGQPVLVASAGPTRLRHATFSADGKKLAYSILILSSDLWSVPISVGTHEAAGAPAQFTRDKSMRNNLTRFSPDGKKIAFSKFRSGTSVDIWVADADGNNATQLTTDSAADTQASWFPGGDRIAFLSNRNNDHLALWSTELASGRDTPILDLGPGIEYAQLSPDGKQVVFNSRKSGTINIWTASIADGKQQQLTFDKELMGFASWSPDGQYLAFEVKRGDDTHIMFIPSIGGEPVQLTFEPGQSFPHDWSPDGDKILYAGLRRDVWNVWWVSSSTKKEKQVTNNSKLNVILRYPAWSPLGNQIVYEYAVSTGNIWMIELE